MVCTVACFIGFCGSVLVEVHHYMTCLALFGNIDKGLLQQCTRNQAICVRIIKYRVEYTVLVIAQMANLMMLISLKWKGL